MCLPDVRTHRSNAASLVPDARCARGEEVALPAGLTGAGGTARHSHRRNSSQRPPLTKNQWAGLDRRNRYRVRVRANFSTPASLPSFQ